jgi:hypothetical protein
MAENVLVRVLKHPLELIVPSEGIRVGVPQASVTVAVPRAALISVADGLHPAGKGV